MLKADGSIAIHADAKAYKPLNWMSPPCTVREGDGRLVATNPAGESITVELHEVLHDYTVDLGDDPGLAKDGVEAELQELLAKRVAALREDLRLVRREYPTDIGPVDLLCRDGEDRAIVVEVKRIGEIAGVEQLLRYQERLDLDPGLAPTVGMFVATRIKPQAKVFAASRGVHGVETDLA
jgi:RecB family endonuclease NucS